MPLYDRAVKLVAVCAFFLSACTIFVALRLWVRLRNSGLRADDWLLFAGLIFWIISTTSVIISAYYGLGAHAEHYTADQFSQAIKFFFFHQIFYCWCIIPIKSSLCVSLMSFTNKRWIWWMLWFLIFLTASSSIGVSIYLLTECNPIEAHWDTNIPGAHCRPAAGIIKLGYGYSTICIFVDFTVALLPILLLWNVRIAWRLKVTVIFILSLGVVASSATLVRLGTLVNFTNVNDYLYGVSDVVLWTMLEPALAIIAGSMVALRPLFQRFFGPDSMADSPGPVLAGRTIGGSGSHRTKNSQYLRSASEETAIGMHTVVNAGSSSERQDDSSQRSIIGTGDIKVTKTVEVL